MARNLLRSFDNRIPDMKLKVFSVYDSKAEAYLPPFFLPQSAMAIRTFSDCANSMDHQFGRHPEDYTLFLLGEWDDGTASFEPELPHKKALSTALELVQAPIDPDQLDLVDETH